MKACDMCAPRTSRADTYELRFDKLPTQDCDVPEHLSKWTGELCPMHADMVRNILKAGPPTESAANPWDPHREAQHDHCKGEDE